MRLSQYFIPTLKETPSEAQIASHRLMLRAGMVNQETSGIYTWLPLGLRVLEKIQKIVCEEQDRIGCHKVLMPTIQPAELWKKSGRYEAYGKEMLRITDRHEREMLYGPTNEEVITDVVAQYVKSYRALPLVLYQIQWKFRDEIRPRFGVMRGREFLMKDGYSFDLSYEAATDTYKKIYESYLRTFRRMGLTAIPVRADTGAIGGDLSHEFQIVAPTGESTIYYDGKFDSLSAADMTFDIASKLYAAADEMHKADECPIPADHLKTARGIEIGHIFYFGTKYSEPLGAKVTTPDGQTIPLEMGSYGIGVSRLVGAIIEAFHDDKGIIWPEAVAPFKVGLINLKVGDIKIDTLAEGLYTQLSNKGIEVLYDDRDERAGTKFADMDLIGLPWQIVLGNRTVETGMVELKNRKTGEKIEVALDQIADKVC
ncbi:proline--tRNA ligase [Candidatus Odyssella acanthamoebae]|uniref:Proline--tRNA ligase n=1 Tax=Candidatus Odyssella acanthamoebae TaxID=91604 RepID=A0A077AVR3_9PROT|nr:proline--tRNA ligase [Candidatus Paracaedibacter acanthamoebae]AIK95753.1 proline--tRNA ligase [Candidatus Paracaedibacter acanthamoebae]